MVLEVEDIRKEFDESIEGDLQQGSIPEEDKGSAAEELKKDVGEDLTKDGINEPESGPDKANDPELEAESDGDQNDEASGPGDKEDGPASKKKKKSARMLEKELEKIEAKAADLTDRYQRLMAEFENARKRMDKEKGQMFDIGAKSVLEKLLPVVDNFERGLGSLSDEAKEDPFVQGVEKIYQQLMDVLTNVGVAPIEATGKEFNPDLHNAVMHVEDEDLPDNVVAEEFQKGYMYKDSVLRYSMVKVAN